MSVTRYSREVDLADLNNAHTFAVLAVPPGSRVLDLGAAEGSVARVLQARGCAVTAVERDPAGVQALAAHGIPFVQADLDTYDGADLPRPGFDVILLLDVLEHLVDPAALLARARSWLAPGGRLLISVPNVAHAAVRLSLLQGRFPRTETGLLDRTHLHFFDRSQLDHLLAGAGLHALDVLTIERTATETELPVVPEDLPEGVMEVIAADPLSRVYQFFLVAEPGAGSPPGGGLLQAAVSRLRSIEHAYRALEDHAIRTEMSVTTRLDDANRELRRVGDYVAHLETQVHDLGTRYEAQGRELGGQLQAQAREHDQRLADRERASREQLEAERIESGARLESQARDLETQFAERERELRDRLETRERELCARFEAQERDLRAQIEAKRLEAGARLELQARELSTQFDARERELHAHRERLEQEVEAARMALHTLETMREERRERMEAHLTDLIADRDMLHKQLSERMGELRQANETVAVLLRDISVQREFAASLAAQVPEIAARGGEARVLAELDEYRTVAPTPATAAALAGEAAEFRRLQQALAIRALARLDAIVRRTPRLRNALRSMARRLAGSGR